MHADGGARRVIDTSVAHSAQETQSHRSHAEVLRFFDGMELLAPGLVPVQRWRPASEIEARAHSAMWGGVGRKPQG